MTETTTTAPAILNADADQVFKHWAAIETKKARLSGTALPLMALSASVAMGASGAALATGRWVVVLPAIVVVLAALAQHAYYLRQTRLFRALGNDVRDGRVRFLDMSTKPYTARVRYLTVLRSRTVWPVHAAMVVVLAVCGIVA